MHHLLVFLLPRRARAARPGDNLLVVLCRGVENLTGTECP